jgi:hypothetical protein
MTEEEDAMIIHDGSRDTPEYQIHQTSVNRIGSHQLKVNICSGVAALWISMKGFVIDAGNHP